MHKNSLPEGWHLALYFAEENWRDKKGLEKQSKETCKHMEIEINQMKATYSFEV